MRVRNYTKKLKESILNEIKKVGNVSLVARKHGILQSTIRIWIKNSKEKDNIKVKRGRKPLIEAKNNFEKEITEIRK